MNQNKKVIVVASLPFLVQFIREFPKEDPHIITCSNEVLKFSEYYGLNCYYVESWNFSFSFQDFKKQKVKFDNLLSEYNNKEIVFGHYQYQIWLLYFIKKLDRNNIVYFNNCDHEFYKPIRFLTYKKEVLYFNLLRVYYLIFTGIWCQIYKLNERAYFLGYPWEKLSKKYSRYKSNVPQLSNKDSCLNQNLNKSDEKVVWVDFGNYFFKIPDSFFDELNYINSNYGLAVKLHPLSHIKPYDKRLDVYEQVPSFIPAELYVREDQVFISVASTSLFNSSCNKKISVIKLFDWHDENLKSNFIEKLDKYNIPMPESFSEFRELINKYLI